MGSSVVEIVDWKNPFPFDCTINVSFKKNSFNSLKLLLPSNKDLIVGGLTSFQIPIEFIPSKLDECEGELEIFGWFGDNGKLSWRYQLLGVVEIESQGGRFKLKCKSKSEIKKVIHTRLEGLKELAKDDIFTLEVKAHEAKR